ncbi:protein of unknown function [Azospirillum lipoferum 4B]|uniref:Uncharacterized protein n=1 Tax=Azospirillum lipoferum (strain 4B) TaxID=862719 RepID=G7Z8F4_AZOL4|nr:protein of unknown function [Azospirillum lipoferum 4B]
MHACYLPKPSYLTRERHAMRYNPVTGAASCPST